MIGSTEVRCKIFLLSKIIEQKSLVDILTKKISLNRKKKVLLSKKLHVLRLHLISPQIKEEQYPVPPLLPAQEVGTDTT